MSEWERPRRYPYRPWTRCAICETPIDAAFTVCGDCSLDSTPGNSWESSSSWQQHNT